MLIQVASGTVVCKVHLALDERGGGGGSVHAKPAGEVGWAGAAELSFENLNPEGVELFLTMASTVVGFDLLQVVRSARELASTV